MIQLVQNGSGATHLDVLRPLLSGTDELWITSPFLATDLGALAAKLDLQKVGKLRLVTSVPVEPLRRAQHLQSLVSLLDFRENWGSPHDLLLEHAPRLHGKAYILFQGGAAFVAVITSANFTQQGLLANAEWGMACREPTQMGELISAIDAEPRRELDPSWIRSEFDRCRGLLNVPVKPEPFASAPVDLPKAAVQASQIWLKPWGVSDDPVVEGQTFGDPVSDLHFSKAKPSGVQVGDLMVLYGVGAQRILGIFQVAGEPKVATEAEIAAVPWKERWPWYVPGANLTPLFGLEWWLHGLWASAAVADFHAKNPSVAVTLAGGTNLGALNWGADKIRLSKEFGMHLVGLISAVEQQLRQEQSEAGSVTADNTYEAPGVKSAQESYTVAEQRSPLDPGR